MWLWWVCLSSLQDFQLLSKKYRSHAFNDFPKYCLWHLPFIHHSNEKDSNTEIIKNQTKAKLKQENTLWKRTDAKSIWNDIKIPVAELPQT